MMHAEESQALKHIYISHPLSEKQKQAKIEESSNLRKRDMSQYKQIEDKVISLLKPVEKADKSKSVTKMFEAIDKLSKDLAEDPAFNTNFEEEHKSVEETSHSHKNPGGGWGAGVGSAAGPNVHAGFNNYNAYNQLSSGHAGGGSKYPVGRYA